MRIIGKIEIKDKFVIKPIRYEGVRSIGEPKNIIEKFYDLNLDEILILNSVSSLYDTQWVQKLLQEISKKIFVPVIAGGGIKSLEMAEKFIRSGADKISICSAITNNTSLLSIIAKKIGSQSTLASIQTMKIDGDWFAFKEMGRTNTKIKITELIDRYQNSGAGEIMITSIVDDGTMKGLNLELLDISYKIAKVPLIICGGLNGKEKINTKVDAICGSSIFHFSDTNNKKIRKLLEI